MLVGWVAGRLARRSPGSFIHSTRHVLAHPPAELGSVCAAGLGVQESERHCCFESHSVAQENCKIVWFRRWEKTLRVFVFVCVCVCTSMAVRNYY